MAGTLAEITALATDPVFVDRVKAAMVRVAVNVIVATNDMVDITPIDKQRRQLAENVIENRDTYAGHFTWMLASRPPITAAITDDALVAAVNTAWNHLAKLPR